MKYKNNDKKKFDDWFDAQEGSPYGEEIFHYAKRWAELIEAEMKDDKLPSKEVVEKLSHEADTSGITGFMYGAAVSTLVQTWEYGEQLRIQHNLATQIQDEGEKANKKKNAVLNPALFSIEK